MFELLDAADNRMILTQGAQVSFKLLTGGTGGETFVADAVPPTLHGAGEAVRTNVVAGLAQPGDLTIRKVGLYRLWANVSGVPEEPDVRAAGALRAITAPVQVAHGALVSVVVAVQPESLWPVHWTMPAVVVHMWDALREFDGVDERAHGDAVIGNGRERGFGCGRGRDGARRCRRDFTHRRRHPRCQ